MPMLMLVQRYEKYLSTEEQILISLDSECQESRTFERVYREFEAQKTCYLPINAFLLKPAQRLIHYQLIINSQCSLSLCLLCLCHFYWKLKSLNVSAVLISAGFSMCEAQGNR